jgi:cytochrome c oxidase subunit IV
MIAEIETVDTQGLRAKSKLGVRVAIWLAVLTVLEYLVAINIDSPLLWLIPFVLAKGWLIMKYFMHIKDLLREGH